MKKLYCVICGVSTENEKPRISCVLEQKSFFLLFAVSARTKINKYFKKNNQYRY